MIELPARVRAAFLRLRKENGRYIEIKHIKNYFFVYQSTSRWDRERKKPVKVPLYIGRITNSGEFIKAKSRKPRIGTNSAGAVPEQQPTQDDNQRRLDVRQGGEKRYRHESTLLTALSMNGRMPLSVLGKMIGLKETAILSQVKKLERRYGIKYVAEIDTVELGYIQFLVTVKFIDQIPKIDELKTALTEDARVQLALMARGEFDLIMYVLAKSIREMAYLVVELRKKIDYKSIWNTVPVFEDYGFIPVRDEFVDSLKNSLLTREYAVLKELNRNGKVDFTDIDKKYGFDNGRSQYSYHKLRERKIIKRITISMQNLPIKYIATIFEDIVDTKQFRMNRKIVLQDIIDSTPDQIDRYLLVDDTFNPQGIVLYLPVLGDGYLESTTERLIAMDTGTNNRTMMITSILVGNFCYRKFDNVYSTQQEALVKEYNMPQLPKVDYEQTGRTKKERNRYKSDIRGLEPVEL
jgi:DNA-binding Lrp family transcriptional regulator